MANELDILYQKAINSFKNQDYLKSEHTLNKILLSAPKNSDVLRILGLIALIRKNHLEAIDLFCRSIEASPQNPMAYSNRGKALGEIYRFSEADQDHSFAVSIAPFIPDLWIAKGVTYQLARKDALAIGCFSKAIEQDKYSADSWLLKGDSYFSLRNYQESFKLNQNLDFLLGKLTHTMSLCSQWKNLDDYISQMNDKLRGGVNSAYPFGYQAIATSEKDLQICAKNYSNYYFPDLRLKKMFKKSGSRIRIGYLGGEFREQATSALIVGMLELHDRSQFEVYIFDNGWDDKSALRKRIHASVDHFIDIYMLSDEQATSKIESIGIDILINLNGFFGLGRQGIFQRRAAPIQVNYLGFPGTIGSPYIDYIVADKIVIPENSKKYYTEKVAYLPRCYQPNDSKRIVNSHQFSRQDFGLPEEGFIFCCFNNIYKINEKIFAIWIRLLSKVEGSVLWLFGDDSSVITNLNGYAKDQGIDTSRIIFAKPLEMSLHLARLKIANLVLDTLPYNAHTTASDALWVGVPIVTCIGKTFPGRVCASILSAMNMNELITESLSEYESVILDIANNPLKYEEIKNKLRLNCLKNNLFDTREYTKDIESIYSKMYSRYVHDSDPDHIE